MGLLQNSTQLAAVRNDPNLISVLVEESLRTVSAQSGMWRIATGDTTLADVSIPAGATILLRYDSANRDPAQFQNPESFDIDRANAPAHIAFGYGIHFCIGALLARKEMEVGFKVLLARLKNIRLDPCNDYRHQPNMMLRGLKQLQISFEPV